MVTSRRRPDTALRVARFGVSSATGGPWQKMLRIARKAGMRIEIEYGEANAYLILPQPHLGTHLAEAFEEQLAAFDLRLKKELRAANDRLAGLSRAMHKAA